MELSYSNLSFILVIKKVFYFEHFEENIIPFCRFSSKVSKKIHRHEALEGKVNFLDKWKNIRKWSWRIWVQNRDDPINSFQFFWFNKGLEQIRGSYIEVETSLGQYHVLIFLYDFARKFENCEPLLGRNFRVEVLRREFH